MYSLDKIVDDPCIYLFLRFPHGFHWQCGSLDTSNRRHHRRLPVTKLHLDAYIIPKMLPPLPATATSTATSTAGNAIPCLFVGV